MFEAYLSRRSDGAFIPAQDEDKEKFKHIPARKTIKVKCYEVQERNYLFLKKYMALMNITFENLPESLERYYMNMKDLRRCVTITAGFYEVKYNYKGEETQVPKSVSFGKMKPPEFADLYNKTIDTILKHYLVGADKEMLDNEVTLRIAAHF